MFDASSPLVDIPQPEAGPEVGFECLPISLLVPSEPGDLRTDTVLHAEEDLPAEVEL